MDSGIAITALHLSILRTDPSSSCFLVLWNEPDGHRVAIEFSIAGLDGSDDDEDGVQDPKDCQEKEPDQDQAKDRGDEVVDEHRDLEVERFLAVGIDLWGVAALGQPDDE